MKALLTLLIVTTATLIFRGETLLISVIDWDETAYALVAREILNGYWPYTNAFDHKPAGIYYHFTLMYWILGDTPFASRMLSFILITANACCLSYISTRFFKLQYIYALALSVSYIAISSMTEGLSSNSEHIINFYVFVWMALTFYAHEIKRKSLFFPIGILMGIAFQCNYLTALIISGYSLGMLVLYYAERQNIQKTILDLIPPALYAITGFILSNILILLPIYLFGNINEYFTLQKLFLSGYVPTESNLYRIKETFKYIPLILFGTIASGYILYQKYQKNEPLLQGQRKLILLLIGIAIGELLAYGTSRRFYSHYFIFTYPALLLWLSLAASEVKQKNLKTLCILAITAYSILLPLKFKHSHIKEDKTALIAKELKKDIKEEDNIYVICAQPVLYQLLNKTPPTKFGFYIHHIQDVYLNAMDTNFTTELAKILDKNPEYIITNPTNKCHKKQEQERLIELEKTLKNKNYRLDKIIHNHNIYMKNQ